MNIHQVGLSARSKRVKQGEEEIECKGSCFTLGWSGWATRKVTCEPSSERNGRMNSGAVVKGTVRAEE